jgi:hypothetical protein
MMEIERNVGIPSKGRKLLALFHFCTAMVLRFLDRDVKKVTNYERNRTDLADNAMSFKGRNVVRFFCDDFLGLGVDSENALTT